MEELQTSTCLLLCSWSLHLKAWTNLRIRFNTSKKNNKLSTWKRGSWVFSKHDEQWYSKWDPLHIMSILPPDLKLNMRIVFYPKDTGKIVGTVTASERTWLLLRCSIFTGAKSNKNWSVAHLQSKQTSVRHCGRWTAFFTSTHFTQT